MSFFTQQLPQSRQWPRRYLNHCRSEIWNS